MPSLRRYVEHVRTNEGPARLWTVIGAIVAVLALLVSVVGVIVSLTSGRAIQATNDQVAAVPSRTPVSSWTPSSEPAASVATRPTVEVSTVSGSPMPTQSPPSTLPAADFLFDLKPIDGTYQTGSKTVNGQTYARSVFHGLSECNPGDGKGYSVEYNVGRQYATFAATAGLSDLDTRGSRTVQFRIDTDLRHDYFELGRGQSRAVSFDIKNALYLRLAVYEPNGSGLCVVDTVAVWGDARIVR